MNEYRVMLKSNVAKNAWSQSGAKHPIFFYNEIDAFREAKRLKELGFDTQVIAKHLGPQGYEAGINDADDDDDVNAED